MTGPPSLFPPTGGIAHLHLGVEDELAAFAVDGIARLDRDSARLPLSRHRVAENDAPVVQAAVMQPAHLAVIGLGCRKVIGEQPLPVEELGSLQDGDVNHRSLLRTPG